MLWKTIVAKKKGETEPRGKKSRERIVIKETSEQYKLDERGALQLIHSATKHLDFTGAAIDAIVAIDGDRVFEMLERADQKIDLSKRGGYELLTAIKRILPQLEVIIGGDVAAVGKLNLAEMRILSDVHMNCRAQGIEVIALECLGDKPGVLAADVNAEFPSREMTQDEVGVIIDMFNELKVASRGSSSSAQIYPIMLGELSEILCLDVEDIDKYKGPLLTAFNRDVDNTSESKIPENLLHAVERVCSECRGGEGRRGGGGVFM